MNDVIVPALTQLVVQLPLLLVYLVGLMLALVFWRRHPTPCVLVLISTAILLVASVAQTFLTQYLIHARNERGWEPQQLSWILSALAMAGSILRAIALSLLLSAVFLGRQAGQRVGPDTRTGSPFA
jgi:hypothetical protein